MKESAHKAVAIVGVGAVLPDAPDAKTFWSNIKDGRYSIAEVPPDRWDSGLYYDPDPKAPDKCYSKIGGWVREFTWEPLKWRLPIPPRVSDKMDLTQKWAVVAAREALLDYGFPERALNAERTAVILGNAMGGDMHLYSAARILFPEYAEELSKAPSFAELPEEVRNAVIEQMREGIGRRMPDITEDTMPGELGNIVAGRIAALFDFKGPNYVADAACASAMAAITSAVEGLVDHDYDAVVTGGIDANMSPSTFVKFCKIGALSATGTRPFAEGADGFVMGEGAVVFLIKRLEDAERDGDPIYAVIRGLGGASDGKGKGITAPNPIGQMLSVRRAWDNAGVKPAAGDLIEGHGTSTRVGDVVELESLGEALQEFDLPLSSVALGSVKSNIGHLKGAAGAAGILKAMFALHEKMLPPSLNFHRPNPGFDFAASPFVVNTELTPWEADREGVRRAGVSAFGFGGSNFHTVMEEYIPGRIARERKTSVSVKGVGASADSGVEAKTPLRGALVIGGESEAAVIDRLKKFHQEAETGVAPPPAPPAESDLRAAMRLAIDYDNPAELADKAGRALKAFEENQLGRWKALRAKGIYLGKGPAPKVAFLFAGQGSQYINMLETLKSKEPLVRDTFAEADRIMNSLVGRPLGDFIFVDGADEEALANAEQSLKQTEITQPAVLTTETALARLLGAYGVSPDMVMGHSLGEYGALVAAGALSFEDALRAVSARGKEMARCSLGDNGVMAAVFGPIPEIEKVLADIEGYVVIANINSTKEAVIGGATDAVERAMAAVRDAGYVARLLQVSHAFHTKIVGPASEALIDVLGGMNVQPPNIPVIANVTGEFYPMGPGVVPEMIGLLGKQVSSSVRFVTGLNTLYEAGARVFVEAGPKRVLYGFVEDVLGRYEDVYSLFTNHPRIGDVTSVNQALCGLYASGLGVGETKAEDRPREKIEVRPEVQHPVAVAPAAPPQPPAPAGISPPAEDRYMKLGHLFADFLDKGFQIYSGAQPVQEEVRVCITGASLGLPGVDRVFDDGNVERMLRGDQFIGAIPMELRRQMVDKHITRLVKTEAGEGRFETIENLDDVIKLAARAKNMDLRRDFGFPEDRLPALDRVTKLAIGAGIDAMRDAGIPLVRHYKTTTKGTKLPDRWMLPKDMRDDTGVIFTSAFPGYDAFAEIISDFYADRGRRDLLEELSSLKARAIESGDSQGTITEIDRRISQLEAEIEKEPYHFDRRFLFRILSMGHSQFAEHIGARGPNTATNAACASGTQAVDIAKDWIKAGRCRRVIVITADDITSDNLMGWFGSGFLASGAAATDEIVEDAATPFDRRRHGLIIGMGGSALVVERYDAALERGIQPICEVLGGIIANSAFHGSRLNVAHMCEVMEKLIAKAESEWGISRYDIAPYTVFVSHETYTPARGGSASAEVFALREVFKSAANQIVVANTKGATGHPMGVGIEDAVATKILETGIVPPVANFKEVDPELGVLNLSKGGSYPVYYALRLAAGFGSQISMILTRWLPTADGERRPPNALGFDYRIVDPGAWKNWLARVTGYDQPELEVFKRTLRVKDQGPAVLKEKPAARPLAAQPPVPTLPQIARPAPAAAQSPPVSPPLPEPAPPPPPAAAAVATDPVHEKVMHIIAEQTGYPTDMLDLDLDLEADLGIDTVKQAEMFAAIRAEYDIPRDDSLKLRDFPTLAHAIQFVYDHRPDLKAETQQPAAAIQSGPPATDPVQEKVLDIIARQTGYPKDMLDLDLDLEADLGIDTVKQAEMFAAIRDEYDIPRDDSLKLRDYPTLAHAIQFVYDRRPDLKAETPKAADAVPEPGAPASDPVQEKVLDIIAQQTGYPKDMLDLDLDLEADLGIDTVKQAEMFAAIRTEYDIPRDDSLKLRDYPTLAHAIQFVYDRKPDMKESAAPSAREPQTEDAEPSPQPPQISGNMEAADAVPRRVPVAHIRPPLELCKRTQVALNKSSRVIVMPDQGGVAGALADRLTKLGVTVLSIEDIPEPDDLIALIEVWKTEGPVDGIYWLPALDREENIADMSLDTWREATGLRVKLLFTAMKALYQNIGRPGSFLVSATRMGGRHGYGPEGATSPLGGGVSGFTKAFKREAPDALVKVVDFDPNEEASVLADLLIEESLRDPGTVEVGYGDGRRWTVGLEEVAPGGTGTGMQLRKDTVFLITGAAGSIVSAITADLAQASGGIFHLLDLTAKPDPSDRDLQRFSSDPDGLKRDIFARLKAGGERATPAMVDKELAKLERSHAALAAIRAVEAAGGTAHYYSVNLLDAGAMSEVMKLIEETSGRIDVLLHAAGLEISHLLPDKSPGEFDLVFDVKSDGWFNLVSNLGEMPLGAAVVFSSIAGRFGNAGQTDYSAANDLLCKGIAGLRNSHPQTRGIAIDWTAWGGIGMAARGSIPTILKQAGIDMLPPQAGIPIVRRELGDAGSRGEILIAQSLGVMLEEPDQTGGLDINDCGPLEPLMKARGIMTGKVLGMGLHSGLTVEAELDPEAQPFLYDHKINGTPVLPGVMGIEALAEVATLMFPDRHLGAIEDVQFLVPFKFYRSKPRKVMLRASFSMEGGDIIGSCRLLGSRILHGRTEPEVTTHFSARIRLVPEPPEPPASQGVPRSDGGKVAADDIYRLFFHGPAYRVVENAWREGDEIVGLFASDLPANHDPKDRPTLVMPRLIELCFQTAGLWELAAKSRMGLPYRIEEVCILRSADGSPDDMHSVVSPGEDGAFDARVVDSEGNVYITLRGYRTMELPDPIEPELLKPLRSVIG